MLKVNNLSKTYGDETILKDVSFVVNTGDRLGLIGPNGCGKTTLLRIIVGVEQADQGSVQTSPPGAGVGYLAQALAFTPGTTIGQVMRQAVSGLYESERRVEELAQRLSTAKGTELEHLTEKYTNALTQFEAAGGYDIPYRIESILAALDLDAMEQDTPVEILSGGQKTRLGLARLLLEHPKILLLDEPTNHLDITALEWLERFLLDYDGAVIIVSHDRAFLDHTVNSILELDPHNHQVRAYEGAYSNYVEQHLRQHEKQIAAYRDQVYEIRRMRQDIAQTKEYARNIEITTTSRQPGVRRYAKKVARKAKSREKKLDRYLASDERVEKPKPDWQMKLEFGQPSHLGQDVLSLEDLSMGYDGKAIFSGVNLKLQQGERIALLGSNGSGKTTLARGVAGEIEPLAGRIRLGASVRLGYYSQEQESLDGNSNAFEEIYSAGGMNETDARRFLHYFLFSGDDVFRMVESLSYGERARLALAKLVASGCNFLVLDEPINHLDIPSRERFEQGLLAFEGTVLVVAHDRYFIQRFATGVWFVGNGTIRRYIDMNEMGRVVG